MAIQRAAAKGLAVEEFLSEFIETNLNGEDEKPFTKPQLLKNGKESLRLGLKAIHIWQTCRRQTTAARAFIEKGSLMTVTLKLKPELEAKATEQAAIRGVSIENFLAEFLYENLNGETEKPFYETATNEE